jgi:hypothetical protein
MPNGLWQKAKKKIKEKDKIYKAKTYNQQENYFL